MHECDRAILAARRDSIIYQRHPAVNEELESECTLSERRDRILAGLHARHRAKHGGPALPCGVARITSEPAASAGAATSTRQTATLSQADAKCSISVVLVVVGAACTCTPSQRGRRAGELCARARAKEGMRREGARFWRETRPTLPLRNWRANRPQPPPTPTQARTPLARPWWVSLVRSSGGSLEPR